MSEATSAKHPRSFLERHHHLLRRLHSLTGIVPIGVFLISHLLTNGSVIWGLLDSRKAEYGHAGVATFQHEVDFIHSIPFLFFIELSLWGAIAFHSILGFYYARTGATNTGSYSFGGNWRYRLQRITGYVGIFFIVYHVGTLRWNWTFLTPGGTAWGSDAELGGKKPMRKDVVTATGYLQPGDEVVCEIEGVGRLVNRVVAA